MLPELFSANFDEKRNQNSFYHQFISLFSSSSSSRLGLVSFQILITIIIYTFGGIFTIEMKQKRILRSIRYTRRERRREIYCKPEDGQIIFNLSKFRWKIVSFFFLHLFQFEWLKLLEIEGTREQRNIRTKKAVHFSHCAAHVRTQSHANSLNFMILQRISYVWIFVFN